MAALPNISDTTAQAGIKSETDVNSFLTAWRLEREAHEESEETLKKTEASRLSLWSWDLTYPELKSTAVRGHETNFFLPVILSARDESYGSVASETVYARGEAVAHLESIMELLTEIKESFEDEMDRQILFFKVKEHLGKLWEIDFRDNNYLLQAVSLLEDSLVYTKSENLSMEQVDGLLEVVQICKKLDLSIDDVRRCGKILRGRKIATLPILT